MSNPYLDSSATSPSGASGSAPEAASPVVHTGPVVPLRGAGPREALERFARLALRVDGRASRSEFWWATGAMAAATLVLQVIPFGQVLLLALLLPTVTLTARRLHDIGRSGWWQLSFYAAWVPGLAATVPGYVAARRLEPEWEALDRETDPDAFMDRVLEVGGTSVVVAMVLLGAALLLAMISFLLWLVWTTRAPRDTGARFGPPGILVG